MDGWVGGDWCHCQFIIWAIYHFARMDRRLWGMLLSVGRGLKLGGAYDVHKKCVIAHILCVGRGHHTFVYSHPI